MPRDVSSVSWNFHDLMLHRVHEVLLLSSPYDAFILEEDGRLTEQIMHEYLGINLRYAPRVWRVSTAADAMDMLKKRKINLVITMLRVSDMDPISFGRQVKEKYPDMPVVLLVYDTPQIKHLPNPLPSESIDKVFIWTGNAKVLMAIIKDIEDHLNVVRDIKKADVRALIYIEDDPYYYSVILPLIYSEIYYHTRNLLDKSLNDTHRLLRMRGRPKILMCRSYEEAEEYVTKYRENILGIISDTRFPKDGSLDEEAGFKLVNWVRGIEPQMPIMLQSTSEKNAEKAAEIHTHFLYKKSPTLLGDIREFMVKNFGFGDFVFRLPDGEEITRATDLLEFQRELKRIPDDSLLYHASVNHFSNWCAARGEFQLGSILRPLKISDFQTTGDMRKYLVEAIDRTRHVQQKGRIVEFSESSYDPSATITNIRTGSLGGKARGLAFIHTMLDEANLEEKFPDVNIKIPKITVIGTDEFDHFMESNNLWEKALNAPNNETVKELFLQEELSEELLDSLRFYLKKSRKPLSVRSSSLFEDSQYQSLAGMYSTYLLSNISDDLEERLEHLSNAIKLIYASVFHQAPKSMLKASIHRQEEEKMAVIIQELAGQMYGDDRFYPTFSGLAQSINYYPVSYLKRNEGIAYVALGLGKTVVEMEKSLRFSPKHPHNLPQFYSPRAILENSQRHFYALQMSHDGDLLKSGEVANLSHHDLTTAESDGSLKWVGSVLSAEDNILRDSLHYEGTRVVTFSNFLKWNAFPLADILEELLNIGERAIGCPVEIEFAGNLYNDESKKSDFYFLQIRPMAVSQFQFEEGRTDIPEEEIFCESEKTLGDDIIRGIQNIIFVKPEAFDFSDSKDIAQEIGDFNERLAEDESYMLIGPGRWGSADPWLGIPVEWNQISNARVIVEYSMPGSNIEPSFGGHFFQNITSLRIGYLTVNESRKSGFIEWNWLDSQEVVNETAHLKWVRLDEPVTIQLDSKHGTGVCIKPEIGEVQTMDEHESSGI